MINRFHFRTTRRYYADARDEEGKIIAWAEIRKGSDLSNDWAGEWCLPGRLACAKECRRLVEEMIKEDKHEQASDHIS